MYKNAHSSSTLNNTTGLLSTPYAPRTSMARICTDYPGSLHRTMSWKKTYFSLSDPHLTRYFQNKLLASFDRESSSRPGSSVSTPRSKTSTATSCRKVDKGVVTSQSRKAHYDYKISVRTGSLNEAGTSARIYVTLRGSKGDVKRRRLTRGGRREFTFAPGSLERFRIQGKDIGELKQITVESEGLKLDEAWFVESVTVINDEGKKWYCPCNQWLSLHHNDCQLSRTLKVKLHQNKKLPEDDPMLTRYTLEVHTGNVRGGGTGANVFVTMMGSKGTSSKTLIKAEDGSSFDRGSVVTAPLECVDIGRLRSLTVEHDNSGFGPDWFLDRIVLFRSENPTKKAYFQCRQWLSRTEGDGSIQRVLRASSLAPPPEPCMGKTYLVSTQTGYQRGAGTDANVFVTLYGSLGSSGERRLDNHPANFERGRKDTFSVQCCDLGELTKVKVRHDNSGSGPSWLLDSVEVKWEGPGREKGGGAEKVWQFPCGQWLEVCDGCGGKLEVELEVGGQSGGESSTEKEKEMFPYKLQLWTGSCPGAGTNANVYMILHGRDNHTEKMWLDNGQRTFLPSQKDEFDVTTTVRVSSLESLTVGHDNSGISPGWFLDKVKVICLTSGSSWDFPCGRWLCMDSGDGRIERELHPLVEESVSEGKGQGNWEVKVWTSDIRGAGTDANVTLQVHCKNGSSQPIPLGDNVANFEQGECDIFPNIHLPVTVGDSIESITLSHDNANPYPDWHLDKVLLLNHTTGEEYCANCGKWLSSKLGECGTSVNLKVVPQHHSIKHTNTTHSTPSTNPPPSFSSSTQPRTQGLPPPRTLPHLSFSKASMNDTKRSETQKNVTISDRQPTSPLEEGDSLVREESSDNERGIDNYDGDDFESVSGSEESEIDLEEEIEGIEERSDVEADRHDGLFGDTRELDSSITNEYLRHLRYEQMSSVESSRVHNGSVTPHRAHSPLVASPLTESKTIPYTIHVVAGAPPAVKPASFLIVTLVGTKGHTHPIKLEPVDSSDHSYTTDMNKGTETFSVEGADVGSLTAIKVRLEGPTPSPPWLVNEINVYSPTSGHTHHFPWGRGLQPGKRLTIERVDQLLGSSSLNTSTLAISPQNGSTSSGLVAYEVKVFTADKKQAGTNNTLHLILVGDKSSSKHFKMKNSSRDPKLQRGQTDSFNIAASSQLGSIKSIKIAHCPRRAKPSSDSKKSTNNSEVDEKWYLFQIVLVRLSDRKKFYFLCRRWIGASESSRNLRYTDVPLAKVE